MVNIKRRFIAGLATLAMTATLATGVAQNTILGDITNSSSIMVADAATTTKIDHVDNAYKGGKGVYTKDVLDNRYTTKDSNGKVILNAANNVAIDNIGKNKVTVTKNGKKTTYNRDIIVVGDSRTCQVLMYDRLSGKNYLSGNATWGGHYLAYPTWKEKNYILSNTYTNKLNNIKSLINKSKATACHVWLFDTINDAGFNNNTTAFIENTTTTGKSKAFVNEIVDYCRKQNKNITIHVVTVPNNAKGTLKVSPLNTAINNYFGKNSAGEPLTTKTIKHTNSDKKTYTITLKKEGYTGILTNSYANNKWILCSDDTYNGYASDGLHYRVNTVRDIANWIVTRSSQ